MKSNQTRNPHLRLAIWMIGILVAIVVIAGTVWLINFYLTPPQSIDTVNPEDGACLSSSKISSDFSTPDIEAPICARSKD